MAEESIAKKTLRSSFWTAIDKFANLGISFIVSMVLARLLSPSDYGTIALLSVFFSISASISECGFSNALIRKKNCTQEDYSTAFLYNICVSFVLYIIVFFLAPYIADFYNQPILTEVARISGISIIVRAVNLTQLVQLTKRLDFKTLAIISLTSSSISGIVGVSVAFLNFGIWALVIYDVTGCLLNSMILIATVRWRPSFVFSKESFQYLWGFGSKMLLTGIISTTYSNIYSIVIGKAYDTKSLGVFNRGQQTATLLPSIVDSIFTRTTLPILAQIQDDKNRLISVYRKMVVLVSAVNFPCCLLLAALAKPFILTLLTEKWVESVPYIQIFCISSIVRSANVLNLNLFQVEGRSDITLKIEVIKKALGFAVVFALLYFGPLALAIGSSTFNLFVYAFNLYYVNKLEKLPYFQQISDLFPCLCSAICSAILAFLITLIPIFPIFQLIVGAIIGLLSYFILTKYVANLDLYGQISVLLKKK